MGKTDHVRVSTEAYAQLQSLCALLPGRSQTQIASDLILEGCKAILSEDPEYLPSVRFLREKLGKRTVSIEAPDLSDIKKDLSLLRQAIDQQPLLRAAEAPSTYGTGSPSKRVAG